MVGTTGHTGCQRHELLHASGSQCVPSLAVVAMGDISTSSAGFGSAFNPQQLPFCSAERLLSEDAKHSLDYPGFIPAS